MPFSDSPTLQDLADPTFPWVETFQQHHEEMAVQGMANFDAPVLLSFDCLTARMAVYNIVELDHIAYKGTLHASTWQIHVRSNCCNDLLYRLGRGAVCGECAEVLLPTAPILSIRSGDGGVQDWLARVEQRHDPLAAELRAMDLFSLISSVHAGVYAQLSDSEPRR